MASASNERLVQLWHPRFWEHLIRDEEDWKRHMDYIHYNPVKHGLASTPADWLYSSFHNAVGQGWYEASWGEHISEEINALDLE